MRILGIDPGTIQLGWGVLQIDGKHNITEVNHGCLKAPKKEAFQQRLCILAEKVVDLVSQVQPDIAVIERIFLGRNVDSAFKLGHIRGICVAECQKNRAKIIEYSPREVKKSITGSGGSDKQVLRKYLCSQLGIADNGESLISFISGQVIDKEEKKRAELAQRSRGTPRIANRLLKRVRDFAEINNQGVIDNQLARYALDKIEVDDLGLDDMDRKIIGLILNKFAGGPVGIETM